MVAFCENNNNNNSSSSINNNNNTKFSSMEWMHRTDQNMRHYYNEGGIGAGYGITAPLMQQHRNPYHQSVQLSSMSPVSSSALSGIPANGGILPVDRSYPLQPIYAPIRNHPFSLPQPQHLSGGTMINQQQQQQQQALYNMHCNEYQMGGTGNSNRMMRNMAEKNRRDKLNAYINDLASLVPMVSNSSKKMDKTSVLRLSATFLRMNQLVSSTKDQQLIIPQFLHSINWSQLLLEEIDGVMLITTSSGKIIFISDNIEKLLGHTQLELFGQSLYNITCPEDHVELKKCLAPDEAEDSTSETEYDCDETGVTSSESTNNSSCSFRSCASRCNNSNTLTIKRLPSSSQLTNGSTNSSTEFEKQRRSFYLRLRQRSQARSEQPHYELVHVIGYLKVPKKVTSQAHRKSRKHKVDITTTNSNEILLVSIMKPFRERRVTQISLIEATSDEYITRHSLDGRIIYSDHRISVVSGYLFDEVCGLPAFNFMHREDVCWVLIALRQMFWRNESYGSSCYRLKTKTSNFIYLKTHGYLELPANSDTYVSFICVNTLVSKEEGEREIQRMRKRFSVIVDSNIEPAISAIAKNNLATNVNNSDKISETVDPAKLKSAIKAMIANLPTPSGVHEDPQMSRETQFAKAKLMSKALPPVSQVAPSIVTIVGNDSPKQNISSPQPITSTTSPTSRPSTPASPPQSFCSSRTNSQDRPSVLSFAPRTTCTRFNTTYNGMEKNNLNTSSSCSSGGVCDPVSSNEFSGTKMGDFLIEYGKRMVKQKLVEQEDFDAGAAHERDGSVLSHTEKLPDEVEDYRRACSEMSRPVGGIKRKHNFEKITSSSVPIKKPIVAAPDIVRPIYHGGGEVSTTAQSQSYSGEHMFTNDNQTHLSPLGDFSHEITFDDLGPYEPKEESPEMLHLLNNANEGLEYEHKELALRMHRQGAQINAIEGALGRVSFTIEKSCLQDDLGKLKEQHSQQEKLLMTLTQDHYSLQHLNKDNINVSNIRNNVGV